jgi:hypothetical protein
MRRISGLERAAPVGLALAGTLLCASGARAQVVAATASVQPAVHAGDCPYTVQFIGGVTSLNRNLPVTFQWIGSGGMVGPVRTLPRGRGGESFAFAWRIDHSQRGWAQIQVLAPQRRLSNRAEFEVVCRERRR